MCFFSVLYWIFAKTEPQWNSSDALLAQQVNKHFFCVIQKWENKRCPAWFTEKMSLLSFLDTSDKRRAYQRYNKLPTFYPNSLQGFFTREIWSPCIYWHILREIGVFNINFWVGVEVYTWCLRRWWQIFAALWCYFLKKIKFKNPK